MSQTSHSGVLFVLLVPAFLLNAQAPYPPPRVQAAVSVTAIDLDVSLTRGGEPVSDVRAEDVVLKIDGKVVPLDYFTRVETGRLTGPGRTAGNFQANPDGLVARTFLLLIDEDHLMPQDRRRVVEASRTLLSRLGPSDRLAVAVLDRQAFRTVSPMETERSTAQAAVDRIAKERNLGLIALGSFDLATIRGREVTAFRELERAVRALGALPGRKEMILVSRGIRRFEEMFFHTNGPVVPIVEDFDDLVREANRARVTIHSIGAGGLEAASPAGGGAPYC
ncbi:MAG: hypothetical protein ACHQPI_01005 [Thermoanaerobaculia bacterium]